MKGNSHLPMESTPSQLGSSFLRLLHSTDGVSEELADQTDFRVVIKADGEEEGEKLVKEEVLMMPRWIRELAREEVDQS